MNDKIQIQSEIPSTPSYKGPTAAVSGVMERFISSADVRAVYGSPIEHGENLVIPSAEILCAGGFGLGSSGEANNDSGGGGGGVRVLSRPVAVIISGPHGVQVEPVVDVTKVALAFFTAIGFMASMAMRMKRNRP